jgi:hypothetical protein
MDEFPSEPRRILQIYDPIQQEQFKEMTVQEKFEWLEAINRLYWLGERFRQQPPPAR